MKIKIKRALLSVFDKSMLDKILPTLKKYKIEILSSGGTFKYIKKKSYYHLILSYSLVEMFLLLFHSLLIP